MSLRSNKIKSLGREKLIEIVNKNQTLLGILRACGLDSHGGYYENLKKILDEWEIDYSHIPVGFSNRKNIQQSNRFKKFPLEDILTNRLPYRSGTQLKNNLIKFGYLENKCSICLLGPEWQNKQITLQLDHISGDKNDNSLSNLRILCPNCHSQTITYCKGKRQASIPPTLTDYCSYKNIQKEDLQKLLWEIPINEIALKFHVTKSLMREIIKHFKLECPSRGHWTKNR